MKNFSGFLLSVLGIALFLGSFGLLWWNEGNNAQKISIAKYSQKNAISIEATNINRDNDTKLIAVNAPAITNDTLTDGLITIPKCLVLDRTVKMYQWNEDKQDEKTTYKKEWSEYYIDSESFENKQYVNPKFPIDSKTFYANFVKLGDFTLSKQQIEKINTEQDFLQLPKVKNYTNINGQLYKGKDLNNPEIGDILISYTYAPSNTDLSIIGEQNSNNSITSLPYKKTNIYIQYNGKLNKEQILERYNNENRIMTFFIRLGGFILMFLGLKLIINPIIELIKIIPLLGNLTDFLTTFILFLISVILSLITIALAWLAYRPLISIMLILIVFTIALLIKKIIDEKRI